MVLALLGVRRLSDHQHGHDVTQDNRRDTWYGETMNQGLKLFGKEEGDCQNWKI